jgi:hypothetical protein
LQSTTVAPRDGPLRQMKLDRFPATGARAVERHLHERHLGGVVPTDPSRRDGLCPRSVCRAAERMKQLAARSMEEARGASHQARERRARVSGRGHRTPRRRSLYGGIYASYRQRGAAGQGAGLAIRRR